MRMGIRLIVTTALLVIVFTSAHSQPANDNCADAIPVAVPSVTPGQTITATPSAEASHCTTSVDDAGGVWFEVVGTGNGMMASLCPFDGGSADYDSKLHVYTGDCTNLHCVNGNDNACALQSRVWWPSEAGLVYRIHVSGRAEGTFELSVLDDVQGIHTLEGPLQLRWESWPSRGGSSMSASADGERVLVWSNGKIFGGGRYFNSTALDAATGEEEWSWDTWGRGSPSPEGTGVYTVREAYLSGCACGCHACWSGTFETGNHDTTTSALLWAHTYDLYNCPSYPCPSCGGTSGELWWSGEGAWAEGIAVSPDASRVFVTGGVERVYYYYYFPETDCSYYDYRFLTLAYDASSGDELWRHVDERSFRQGGRASRLDPDGQRLYESRSSDFLPVTISFDAHRGTKLWESSLGELGTVRALEVTKDGRTVLLAGDLCSEISSGYPRCVVSGFFRVAYDAETGTERWRTTSEGEDWLTAIAADTRFYFVGSAPDESGSGHSDAVAVARDGMSGALLWEHRYDGPASGNDSFEAVTSHGSESLVCAAGMSEGPASGEDLLTIGIDSETGQRRWTARYDDPLSGDDSASAVAMSQDGSTVYVVGWVRPSRRSFPVVFSYRNILLAAIDIKPGSDTNPINPRSWGVIPVAILGSEDFDVTNVDVTTLAFGSAGAASRHDLTDEWTYIDHLEDVNLDGSMDLVMHYSTQETGILCGDTEASLSGELLDGRPFQGTDEIRTVGCPPPERAQPAQQPEAVTTTPATESSVFGKDE